MAQIIGLDDGSTGSSAANVNQTSIVYNGIKYAAANPIVKDITFSSGSATIYLTTDGTAGGPNAFNQSLPDGGIIGLSFGFLSISPASTPTLTGIVSGNVLTISMTQQQFGTLSVLTNLLFNSVSMVAVANGTTAKITVIGVANAL